MTQQQVNQIAYEITGCAIEVHKQLGPGLLESIYEDCMAYELGKKGLHFERQVEVPVYYKGILMGTPLKLDLIVENTIIVELKAVSELKSVFQAQLLTYMKLTKKPKGLLINFTTENIVKSLVPLVNDYFFQLPSDPRN